MNLKSIFPHGSNAFFSANSKIGREIQASQSQPPVPMALVKTHKRTSTISGRVRVVYTGCFVRPQDADNLAGATKICTDTLRTIGLLLNDDPYSIELSWRQRKVEHFTNERLEIEITP